MSDSKQALDAVEVHGITRAAFLVRGALTAGAMYGAGAASSFVTSALAQAAGGDVDTLNFALTLENVEAGFYKAALAKVTLPAPLRTLATELGSHEQQHASALSQAITQLGGSPAAAPAVSFRLTDAKSFLALAQTLEETGVSAYNGAIAALQSPDLIAAAASIAQVEARHAAAIRIKNAAPPAPAAFDKAISQQQAQAAIAPFLRK